MAASASGTKTSYYEGPDIDERIFEALRGAGLDSRPLDIDAIAALDEFHALGRAATIALAGLSELRPGIRLLDVGAGIGGPARYLAARRGAQVTAVDATARFCRANERLCEAAGLEEQVEVICADGCRLPMADGTFERAWTQALIQNVPDKRALLGELRRVLRPGGRLSMFEVVSCSDEELYFPVPWGDGPGDSFLLDGDELRRMAESLGFGVLVWKQGLDAVAEIGRASDQMLAPPIEGLGLELLMPDFEERMEGLARNVAERRIELVLAVFEL